MIREFQCRECGTPTNKTGYCSRCLRTLKGEIDLLNDSDKEKKEKEER